MTSSDSFFISTGSNIGDKILNLKNAKLKLSKFFVLISESRVYESAAVDYLAQPDFYNQVLEFKIPSLGPEEVMNILLTLELEMGRNRIIPKGPRLIDLDILFWGFQKIHSEFLQIPHPRLFERSFVVLPLSELQGFNELKLHFNFNFQFDNHAKPLS